MALNTVTIELDGRQLASVKAAIEQQAMVCNEILATIGQQVQKQIDADKAAADPPT